MNELKIFSLTNTQFHGNGISGKGFYSAVIAWKYNASITPNMLVTFEENDGKIDIETCRVISLDNLKTCWRGDVVGEALVSFFKRIKIKDLYSYMKLG